jgi:hypothetical protein
MISIAGLPHKANYLHDPGNNFFFFFFILKNGHPGTGRIAPQITKAI